MLHFLIVWSSGCLWRREVWEPDICRNDRKTDLIPLFFGKTHFPYYIQRRKLETHYASFRAVISQIVSLWEIEKCSPFSRQMQPFISVLTNRTQANCTFCIISPHLSSSSLILSSARSNEKFNMSIELFISITEFLFL